MQSKVKVLLVDDLEENLLALGALLSSDEVEVLKARSGSEALELLLAHDVALALLDVQMPEMDGFQLAEMMRGSARTRDVPLIFVTAGGRDQVRVFRGYDSGAVDFLYKPIEPYILRSKAAVFFQLYRQKQQLAEDLRERTETLRLNEMFTAVLGHDLRNPLSAILATAHLLQRSPDDTTRVLGERVSSSGRRMQRMIEDVLDLVRARLAGGIHINPQPADFGALVQRVVQEHQTSSPGRGIELEHSGNLLGEWDGERLTQAASNLVGNALQHGRAGTPVRLHLDGTRPDQVTLSVANTGRIAEDLLPYLFDPFRSGRREGRSGGLGLGLYIVQQIVTAHRGRIEVSSGEDERTEFRVQMPRRMSA